MRLPADKRIRVVYLVGQLGMGGSERQLYLLLKHLDPARFVPRVVVFNDSPNDTYEEELRALSIEVVQVPTGCVGAPRRARWLLKYLRKIRPDVVHSWTTHDNIYAGLVGMLAGVPVRWGSLRGSLRLEGYRSLPALFKMLSLRSVSRIVVNSEAIREELTESGYPASRTIVLKNCVEPTVGDAEGVDLSNSGIEPRHRVIGIVGNLRPVKNHRMFLRSMAQVLPGYEDVRAAIVGQPIDSAPGLEDSLRREISDLGVADRVALLGFRSDVPELMNRFEVLCLTSEREGLPNVILEAMAAGKPVVATSVGGVPELIEDGETGFLVPAGDVETLAARVKQILDNQELGARLGRAARMRAEQVHGCQNSARKLEDLYEEALRQKRRGGVRVGTRLDSERIE